MIGRRNSFDATFGEPNRMELEKPEMGMDGTAGRSTQIGHEVSGTDTGSAGMTPKALLVCFSGKIGSGKTSTSNAVGNDRKFPICNDPKFLTLGLSLKAYRAVLLALSTERVRTAVTN